jgi:protease-4
MRFIGKVWRLLVAVKDGLVLILLLLFFGALYTVLTTSPKVPSGAHGALLLDLDGSIVEQPTTAAPLDLLSGESSLVHEYRRRDVVQALESAATDDRVEAVALDLDAFTGGGQTTLSDVARAIDKVRKANKAVVAYASGYTDDSYQLAAHASEIWLNPLGTVLIRGPGGTQLYYKGLMDKIGVSANVYKVGTYKAATEPYTRSDMSPEARENLQAVAGALWEDWNDEVRRARPKAQLASYIADPAARFTAAGGDMAKAALAAGLVDRIGDRTAFGERLAEMVGNDNDDLPGSFRTIDYDAWTETNPASDPDGNIGILTVAGEIVDGDAPNGTAGGTTIKRLLHRALAERDLDALVVRVDSPGGSVLASEQIRQAILDAKAQGLPVVVSMGSLAASGGYWVSTAADHIMAEPDTITGSIGVFGILPSFEGTLKKLGVGADGIKTTPLSGEPDPLRGPSPQADRLIQMSVENIYQRFLGIVSSARKMPASQVDRIGQGRIWDGGTARQLGLVDSYGSIEDAIAEAARRAKIDPKDASPVYLEKEPSFYESLFESLASEEEDDDTAQDAFTRLAQEPRLMLLRVVPDANHLLAGPAIQVRCLECGPVAPARPTRKDQSALASLLALFMP